MLHHHDSATEAARPMMPATLGMLLQRVALQIDDAAESLNDMQAALSPILMQAGDPGLSKKAQNIDLIEQIMRDLTVVVSRIAETPAADQTLDAAMILDGCKLANVARRLHGLEIDLAPEPIEFF